MTDRVIYMSDGVVALGEYVDSDSTVLYDAWSDPLRQLNYNDEYSDTFEGFTRWFDGFRDNLRFFFTVTRKEDDKPMGAVMLSGEQYPPDLAIFLAPDYRRKGYGSRAFNLGIRYCFETLKLDKIFAGCYPHNRATRKILDKFGFERHPEGDFHTTHYKTGEPLVEHDFVLVNPK